MKSFFSILFLCLLPVFVSETSAQSLDSLRREALSARLEEYFEALKHEPLDVRKNECDFLVESCTDSLVRQFVALKIYANYLESPVMGDEAVAIHVLDKWFFPGTVKMNSEVDLLNARIFADFNRQSLVGEPAPELLLTDMDGNVVRLFPRSSDGNENNGRFAVLYFYDTDCAKCMMETIMLRNLLETEDFPVDFYAVYVGDDREAWKKYVAGRFGRDGVMASVHHLWDPGMESDFQRKYGVIQTPRLFLAGPDGVILGRGLDAGALSFMLHGIFDERELEYGSEESEALFDAVFSSSQEASQVPFVSDVEKVADHIAATTLAKGDTLMFRQMAGDLLYYSTSRRGEAFMEGSGYLIDKYILSRPDVWRTRDDTLKVIGMARMVDDLLSKAKPGTVILPVKVQGILLSRHGEKPVSARLDRLGGKRNIIIFHTSGCEVCRAEKEAARALLGSGDVPSAKKTSKKSPKGTKVLMVNVDDILTASPELADRLFESFDLSALPFIVETDRKGRVVRRYLSLL